MLSKNFKFFFARNNIAIPLRVFLHAKSSPPVESNVVKSIVRKISIPNLLLDEYIWSRLDKWHEKTALVCAETGRSYTFSELYKKSRQVARFLCEFHSLKQQDTVAIVLPTSPEFPLIMLGAIQAGLKVTLVNNLYTPSELRYQFLTSDTKIIFTFPEYLSNIKQAIDGHLNVPIVAVDYKSNLSFPSKTIKFSDIINNGEELNYSIIRRPDDTVIIPYSSGTTGTPKGVELTHKNILSNLIQMTTKPFKLQNDTCGSYQEVALTILPMFHIYGQTLGTLNLLSSGSKLVTLSKFEPQAILNTLREHQPTFFYAVPHISIKVAPRCLLITNFIKIAVLFFINSVDVKSEYLRRIKTLVSGAAPLGASDIERLLEKSNGATNILQVYGLTEASPLTHLQVKNISNGIKIGGSGLVIPNTEYKIVAVDDETMAGLGPNQSGEVVIRGPQVMKRYYKNLEATRETLVSGWLRTGDIGHYDEDGHMFVTGRLKDLIKVKGFQVAPAELEELLRSIPDVEDAAVVGVPNQKFGEVPKAFVVLKKNVKLNVSAIHKYIEENAAKYKQLLGGVVAIDSIPRNPSGKILRKDLRGL